MEVIRENLQVFVRRFGLLSASCCESCCGEQVSLAQCHILLEIRRMDNPSIQQVADELGMDITTLSRQVKTLEGKGLITRQVSPADRRISLLGLTDEGSRVLAKIDLFMTAKMDRIFSFMTPFEREVTIRSLGLLNEALAKVNEGASEDKMVACCK